jgi:hypothetical protein
MTQNCSIVRHKLDKQALAASIEEQKKERQTSAVPFLSMLAAGYFHIMFNRGTIRSETMLMILIIGLTAGPAVSL